jgi:M6 family metalloprotease-like protein
MFVLMVVGICFSLMLSTGAISAPLTNMPVTIQQPDGTTLGVFASGDEFYNWMHDEDQYTIVQDANGYYVYAVIQGTELLPSTYIVGKDDPATLGLEKNLAIEAKKAQYAGYTEQETKAAMAAERREMFAEGSPANPDLIRSAPKKGTINNLVIFIRCSDDPAYTSNISTYSTMFNSTTSGANSMYNYYKEVSYNTLSITTHFFPTTTSTVLSYQDSHSRSYFSPYSSTNTAGYQTDAERTTREHTLLVAAVNGVKSQIPASLNLDGDNDGKVDNVCFIMKGTTTAWNTLLWPHMWSLYSQEVYISTNAGNKRVYTFNFQLETSLSSSGVGVLCHEMFHSLGAPDLYHYTSNGINPVGKWDIMEYDRNPPQHMSAFMKYRYGTWISSMPKITSSGTYSLNPLTTSTGNCYRIDSPKSSTEYFVVEYRKKNSTFENSLPGEGLLVYRVNTAKDGQGNANGPPDELYVYRPGGTTTANGTVDSANFNSAVGRTQINDSTNPSSFLSTGAAGGLNISNIGAVGSTISFTVSTSTSGYSITSPTTSTPLTSTTPTFYWTAGAAEYWLYIGSSVGASNYYNSGSLGTATSKTVSGLPSNGSTVYVKFWYKATSSGSWASKDYTYTAMNTGGSYSITSPSPGSILTSTTPTFSWTAGAAEYWLYIGSSVGASNYYNSGSLGTATSKTVSGLPSNGSTVYVKFWYKATSSGSWASKNYTYTAMSSGGGGFEEYFKGSATNWIKDSGSWSVVGSEWYYSGGTADYYSDTTYNQSYSSLDYSASLWRYGYDGSSNYLIVRASGSVNSDGDLSNNYSFNYTRNGYFCVWKRVAGVDTELKAWTYSSAINQGSAWNTLRVKAFGSNLYFYINGYLVWYGTDSSLSSGRVGVGMYRNSTSTGNGFYVDWAKLTIPTSQTIQDAIDEKANLSLDDGLNASENMTLLNEDKSGVNF